MVSFPNCKINLGLNIVGKRSDGYHDLETCFLPVTLREAVEIVPSASTTRFTVTGTYSGNDADNLCMKAYRMLQEDFPALPPVSMHLHKVIPAGAGLGGGSADAAATLQLLNAIFRLGLSPAVLGAYALRLGSDCPFFLVNRPAIATGRGEILREIPPPLGACRILLINPGIHISTGVAFKSVTPRVPDKPIGSILSQPLQTWRNELVNDFEAFVFERYPEVGRIKTMLYDAGARYASMSGSGSTVYGIFDGGGTLPYTPPAHWYHAVVEPVSAKDF